MVNNRQLAKVAVYGGVFAISGGVYMQFKIKERIRDADFYRQAMKHLRGHQGAVSVLGEPIKDGFFDLANTEKNSFNDKAAHMEVAVKGPKNRGTLMFWSEKTPTDWIVKRMELHLKNDSTKKLSIVKDDTVQE